jgi:protein-tyrosine phosphatase
VELAARKALPTIGETPYLLTEFYFDESFRNITQLLNSIAHHGYIPVIAHPERYTCLQKDPALAEEWIRMGCQLQMNKDSVFGAFGRRSRRTALQLLKKRQYTYVGSDAHSPYGRTTHMGDIREYLEEKFSPAAAGRLLERSAERWLAVRQREEK